MLLLGKLSSKFCESFGREPNSTCFEKMFKQSPAVLLVFRPWQ